MHHSRIKKMFVALTLLGGCSEDLGADMDTDTPLPDDLDIVERSGPPPTLVLGQVEIDDTYLGMPGVGHTACDAPFSCIRADLVDRYNGLGGWFQMGASGSWFDPTDGQGIQHVEPGQVLAFDVDVDYEFMHFLTEAQLTDLAVVAKVIVRPHFLHPSGTQPEQVLEHVFDGGTDDLHRFEFEPNWVDSDIEIRIEVDSPLIEAPPNGWSWTQTRRIRSGASLQISPKFLPIGLIGRPPGSKSWGEVANFASQSVKQGVSETLSQTSSNQTGYTIGIGPATLTHANQVVEKRREAEGTFRTLGWRDVTTVRADSSVHRNGNGDLLVVVEDPSVDLWEAPADRDFRIADAGTLAIVPMEELVLHRNGLNGIGPGSSNSFVSRLNRDEVKALIDLHRLTEYPSWQLHAPRYHLLRSAVKIQDGSFGQTIEITKTDVENAISGTSHAEITSTSGSAKLPITAIVNAIWSYKVPFSLVDAQAAGTVVDSTEVELVRSLEVLESSGIAFRYNLKDEPGVEICSEAYWDTLFNTVVFRNCSTPEVSEGLLGAYMAEFALDIEFVRYSVDESVMKGNLGGSMEMIELTEEITGVTYTADVNEIGNFAIPNLRPGRYIAKHSLSGSVYTIELSKDDKLTVYEGDEG